jgi:hypothetical protein
MRAPRKGKDTLIILIDPQNYFSQHTIPWKLGAEAKMSANFPPHAEALAGSSEKITCESGLLLPSNVTQVLQSVVGSRGTAAEKISYDP